MFNVLWNRAQHAGAYLQISTRGVRLSSADKTKCFPVFALTLRDLQFTLITIQFIRLRNKWHVEEGWWRWVAWRCGYLSWNVWRDRRKNLAHLVSEIILTRKCTLWRCKSTPTPKAKLLWMTSHYGPTVVRSVTEIPFHVFIW